MRTKIKKIKKSRSWLLIAFFIGTYLFNTSCKEEFFKASPPGAITEEVLVNREGAEALLVGAYAALNGTQLSCYDGQYAGTDNRMWGSIAADDATTGSSEGDHPEMWIFELYEGLPSDRPLERKWNPHYDGISRANDVLEIINKAGDKIPEDRANEMKAEARFIRGWLHYNLRIVFKYIPYITRNLENPPNMPYSEEEMEDPAKVPNMTSDNQEIDVWPLIESDIEYAINNLPEEQELVGKIDKYAAEVVLARVHLMQGDYDAAEPLLRDIIDNSGAELVEHFYWNYDVEHNNNKESIFEIQSASNPQGTANTNSFCTALGLLPQGLGGWGHYNITLQAVNAFQVDEKGLPIEDWRKKPFKNDINMTSSEEFIPTDDPVDPRLDWTVGRRGIPFLDWGIMPGADWIRSQPFGGAFNSKKHMHYQSDPRESLTGGQSTQNIRKYRLAHVYLWMAEIEANKGNYEEARWYVNELRKRAANHVVMGRCYTYVFDGSEPDVDWDEPAANYEVGLYEAEDFNTEEKAWEAIRTEFLLETAGFGHRFFDLRRWDKTTNFSMVDWINDYIQNDSEYRPLLSGKNFGEKDKYFWIPQSAIDEQPGVIKQNPDY